MGSSNHLKRLAMPRSWPLPRKTTVWVTRAAPGAHALDTCMPINVIIRDILGFARSTREVRHILHNGLALVDGRVCKDTRRGVGLMDVLTIGENNYRCILDSRGRLQYHPISAKEASWKVCRVDGKTTIKGGKTQVNLHDGRNILCDDAAEYNTGDSVKISLPSQDVIEHIRFASGTRCFLTGGSHVGEYAEIKDHIIKRSSMPNEVQFETFGTTMENVFAVGKVPLPSSGVSE